MAKKRRKGDQPRFRGRRRVMNTDDAMAKLVTNRRSKFPTWSTRIRDLIKAHGSEGARQRIGVSKSTWRAWTKGKREPNKANADRLRTELNTRAVRRAGISRRRQRQLARFAESGGHLKFTAYTGPRDSRYARFRQIRRRLPPEVAAALTQAYEDGGPDAAREVLLEELRNYYQENTGEYDPEMDVILEDISDIRFED